MKENTFYRGLLNIALPVTLQSLLQSSFSVIDQIMIGQLGSDSIAGIGLAGKFASIYSVVLGAIAAAAGIMIAQYIGQKNRKDLNKSFYVNFIYSLLLAVLFMGVCLLFSGQVMQIYTRDRETGSLAAGYLAVYCLSFLPMAVTSIASVMLRCLNAAVYPLAASVLSVILNTALNYVLIFGRFGFPALGMRGAAAASVISQVIAAVFTVLFLIRQLRRQKISLPFDCRLDGEKKKLYLGILAPILVCEFLWSLGENMYGIIYGNMGTEACAAMTMTGSIQALMIGALSGLSQAAGIMVGKSLGEKEYDRAYADSKRLMGFGLIGSLVLSFLLIVLGRYYVEIYHVSKDVKEMTYQILVVFAIVSPIKVQNMILGGGIIRSGGKTKYMMWIDFIGTWIFGVPLGFLSAFAWKLPIAAVYFILSMEETVRLGISAVLFRSRRWMESL